MGNIIKNIWELKTEKDKTMLDGSRVWKKATNKSGFIEEMNTEVAILKEYMVCLKNEIKIDMNRKPGGFGQCS